MHYKKCCKNAANFAQTRQLVVSARSWVRAALALRQLAIACRYRSTPCVSFSAHSLSCDSPPSELASSASPTKVSRLGVDLGLRLPTRAVFAECGLLVGVAVGCDVLRAAMVDDLDRSGWFGCSVRAAVAALGRGMYMLSSSDEDSCTTSWCCATCWCRTSFPFLLRKGLRSTAGRLHCASSLSLEVTIRRRLLGVWSFLDGLRNLLMSSGRLFSSCPFSLLPLMLLTADTVGMLFFESWNGAMVVRICRHDVDRYG